MVAVLAAVLVAVTGCKAITIGGAGGGAHHTATTSDHGKKKAKHHHGKNHARKSGQHHAHRAAPAPAGAATLLVEPQAGFSPVYRLISHAKRRIDITMYEFADTTAEHDLGAAARRHVHVRVILGAKETSINSGAYNYFQSHGVQAVWSSPKYFYTHEKSLVIDGRQAVILTANLTSRYYSTSRDFGVIDKNRQDVDAIERVFGHDFAHTSVTPGDGHDLVWSPTDSEDKLLAVIRGAKSSLRIYSEEMSDSTIEDALAAAARRGVSVQVCGENQDGEYDSDFARLAKAGVKISYFSSSTGFYIHGKVVEADYGTPRARVFIGSENFSNTSLNRNRELGLIISSHAVLATIAKTFGPDFRKGKHVAA